MVAAFERDASRIDELSRASIDQRRQAGQEISEAHNEAHLNSVANLAVQVGRLYGQDDRTLFLSYVAGKLHDFFRYSTEEAGETGDRASADAAREILSEKANFGTIPSDSEEREAVAYAIANHSSYPEWLADPATRNDPPRNLKEAIRLNLFVADKMEANGPIVIARRSSFVAGDRLKSESGDLQEFGFRPERDEGLVVALESALRLTFINPEEIYPERLKPLVGPLYAVQREFVTALCAGLLLPPREIARIISETKNAQGQNMLQARRITAPDDIQGLQKLIEEKGGITTDAYTAVSMGDATAALDAVGYFSRRYREDLDTVIAEWNPALSAAKKWKDGMVQQRAISENADDQRVSALAELVDRYTKHDESRLPLTMGPAVRVPGYAHQLWGVETPPEREVVRLYKAEWALGDKGQLANVSKAAIEAGLGNYPEVLCQEAARIAGSLVEHLPDGDTIRILDVGAGPGQSAEAVYQALPEDVKSKVELILLDLSSRNLSAAEERLRGINMRTIQGSDLDISANIDPGSIDILLAVAAVHHHAHIPFATYYDAIKPGGFAVFADWHHSLWGHPHGGRRLIAELGDQDALMHFDEVYPNGKNPPEKGLSPEDEKANQQIIDFWKGWAAVSAGSPQGRNAIWWAEGHRPVERYVEGMQEVGFDTASMMRGGAMRTNPHRILPDSTLLMLTVGQKHERVKKANPDVTLLTAPRRRGNIFQGTK